MAIQWVKKTLRILDEFRICGQIREFQENNRRVAGRVFLMLPCRRWERIKGAEPQHIEPAPCGMLVVQIGWCGKNYLYRLADVAAEAC